jgi:hypothetical protein
MNLGGEAIGSLVVDAYNAKGGQGGFHMLHQRAAMGDARIVNL